MTLSDVSIRNPVFAWMLMAALILFGWLSFQRMGVSEYPDVDSPFVSVSVSWEGAAPEVMEMDVVDPIEDAVLSIPGIKNISSSSRTGSASVTVEFGLDKSIDLAMQEVQNAMARVIRRLPKEIDAPVVTKNNPEDNPILWLAVSSSELKDQELMKIVRDQIKDQFSTIDGISEIILGGYVDPALRVWVSADKLNRYQLTVGDLLTTIQQEHAELPAGQIETSLKEANLRFLGEAPSAKDFSKIPITRRGGSPNFSRIQLSDVARVEEGLADLRRKSRSQGEKAIGLGIRKQRGANSVAVAQAAKRKMLEVQKTLPSNLKIGVRFDSTQFIEEAIGELNFTLIFSALLTALVCFLFLGSWSSTWNILLSIPTSIIGAFFVLRYFGFTLNTFTLLGLSLAIGIVVDDAIMMLENITRHAEMGKSRIQAAIDGAREITFSALAATLAIVAIFLPVAFMEGVLGKFLYVFGITLSVAVLLSLVEALTLTPMRCSQFLSHGAKPGTYGHFVEKVFHQLSERYKNALEVLLRHRWKTLFASLLIFVGSMSFLKILKSEFVPAQDQSRLTVRLQTDLGSSLEFTDQQIIEVEKKVSAIPEVESYFSSVGGFGGGQVNTGFIFLTLKDPSHRPKGENGKIRTHLQVADQIRADLKPLKAIKAVVQDPSRSSFGGGRGFPVEFTVRGGDWDKLKESAEKMMKAMKDSNVFIDVDTNYKEGLPEIRILPERDQARMRGVSLREIGETLQSLMGGFTAGKYSQDGHRYDVRLRLEEVDRQNPEDVYKLFVRNNRGELISLRELVKVETKPSLQAIIREDRERAISIYSNLAPKVSQEEGMQLIQKMSQDNLPAGYRAVLSGSSQTFKESFQSLFFALFLGIVVSYMILASQFNSFRDPILILIALPFSVSGAFVALWVTGQTLNIYSYIGIILLMGIVKKNSILLVDFTNQARGEGRKIQDALLHACPLRLRPILMTSTATIAGAIPPALAIGPGAESRIPMAVTIIGGVMISTVLTLFVVPIAYSLFTKKDKEI